MHQIDHATAFMRTLFRDGEGMVDMKILAPKKEPGRRFFTDCDEAVEHAMRVNAAGYSVYVGVNPRKREGGRETDVLHVRALFLDLDLKKGANPEATRAKLGRWGLPPSMTVWSGNGAHMYLILKEAVPCIQGKIVAERLCKVTDSDPVHNVNRIARLPGTVNWKDPPRWCYVAEMTDYEYTLDEVAHVLDRIGAPAVVQRSDAYFDDAPMRDPLFNWEKVRMGLSPRVVDLITFGIQNSERQVTRSEADWVVVTALVDAGLTNDQIRWVYCNPEYGIGSLKYRQSGDRYLNHTIKKARQAKAVPLRIKKSHFPAPGFRGGYGSVAAAR